MLFRRDIEPNCAYCERGARGPDGEIVCARRGTVAADYHCKGFRYDPLKRVPPRPATLKLGGFRESDFSL